MSGRLRKDRESECIDIPLISLDIITFIENMYIRNKTDMIRQQNEQNITTEIINRNFYS